jgi:uncharacterized protein YgbK (DUF1537 family)
MTRAAQSNDAPVLVDGPFDRQPPAAGDPHARERIRDLVAAQRTVLIVLDDDPTGSQVVHGVPILTSWDAEALSWAFDQGSAMVFILTNTRSLPPPEVETLLTEAMDAVDVAARRAGRPYVVACRGDSTLRGHYPLETDVVARVLSAHGHRVDGVLLVPAYLEAGRVTVEGVQYASVAGRYLPVSETDYARDATFGFRSARLRDYVEERTDGRIRAGDVVEIRLTDLRLGGPAAAAELLSQVSGGGVAACDALSREDLDTLVLGLLEVEARGRRFVYRAGPSFVAARVGMEGTEPIRPPAPPTGRHGLVVVGSHVDLTGRQLERLRAVSDITTVELDVSGLLDPAGRKARTDESAQLVVEGLASSDVLLVTSRRRIEGGTADESLSIARLVSESLVRVVRQVRDRVDLGWVIAKGGITSHDVAVSGLGITRAVVAGQLFPGMTSVWIPAAEDEPTVPANMPYVVFAGNVGDDDSLAQAVQILRGERRA